MKKLALVAVLSLSALAFQESPKPAAPGANHQWLQQLVGQWTATSEMFMGEDAEPMKMESTENVRSLGGLWIVAEGQASLGGQPFTSLLTVGFDEAKQTFVGTWIDTMQSTLWIYHRGSLDDARKTLTLESEGPALDDPTKMTKYRDALTLESQDHKVHTASMLGADGKWLQYLKTDLRRKP